ncbi:hypothetical protein ACRAWD_01005 [Caulobacter segnis]
MPLAVFREGDHRPDRRHRAIRRSSAHRTVPDVGLGTPTWDGTYCSAQRRPRLASNITHTGVASGSPFNLDKVL